MNKFVKLNSGQLKIILTSYLYVGHSEFFFNFRRKDDLLLNFELGRSVIMPYFIYNLSPDLSERDNSSDFCLPSVVL